MRVNIADVVTSSLLEGEETTTQTGTGFTGSDSPSDEIDL
jgi:hypothetical protein